MHPDKKKEIAEKKKAEIKKGESEVYIWQGKGNYEYGGQKFGPGAEVEMLVSDYENEPQKTKALFGEGEYKKPGLKPDKEIIEDVEKAPPPAPPKKTKPKAKRI